MHIPSFGSATAKETFFSSLISSRRLARRGETFPSTREATSSRAVAALSNFLKLFSLILYTLLARRKIFFQPDKLGRHSSRLAGKEKASHIQIRHAFRSRSLRSQVISLQELLVLRLEQGITRAGFSKDKKRHGERPRLSTVQNWRRATVRGKNRIRIGPEKCSDDRGWAKRLQRCGGRLLLGNFCSKTQKS